MLLFVFWGSGLNSQTPEPPVFDYVSINPDNGNVTIHWKPSPSSWVTGYTIQEELVSGQNFPILTVNITAPPYSHTFTYPKVLAEPVNLNLVATGGVGKESLRTVPSHVTVHCTVVYDTCRSSIIVKWSPYIGWGTKLKGYSVFLIDENLVITKVIDLAANENDYIYSGVLENKSYCFYISAIRDDGISSLSNKACLTTTAPLPPSFITGDYTRYSGSNNLNLHFSIDPATVSDAYRLYRAEGSGSDYSLVTELQKAADGTIAFTDELPALKVYNYKLTYLNRCKNEGVSSVPINNILLKGKSEAMINKLSWNTFATWVQGIKEIQLFRAESNGAQVLLQAFNSGQMEYEDKIDPQAQLSGDICYQVKAVSEPDANGITQVSESNVFCVNMTGEVFVPNAFTPNNDGVNDIFKPSFAVLPSKYSFIIYNRYGAKVFETSNISEGWDGTLANGSKALEGTYIFYLRIENGAGKVNEKRGNFNVIYP